MISSWLAPGRRLLAKDAVRPLFCARNHAKSKDRPALGADLAAIADRPGPDPGVNLQRPAMARSRATRSLISGCVLNRLAMPPPKSGATMNISAVDALP